MMPLTVQRVSHIVCAAQTKAVVQIPKKPSYFLRIGEIVRPQLANFLIM